jgi:hypothetical protein
MYVWCACALDAVVDSLILGSGLDSENEEDDAYEERAEQAAERGADEEQSSNQKN